MDLPRLYAILDLDLTRARGFDPFEVVDAWLSAGVRLVQLRAKALAGGPLLELAEDVGGRVQGAGAMFIVNDRPDVATMAAADGVHLGQDDLPVAEARRIVGAGEIIGLSTHSMPQLDAALREPISYAAIGPVFATRTKGGAVSAPVGVAGVRDAAARASAAGVPLVAIGGITLSTAREVLTAGASSVAVISDLLDDDLIARATAYLKLLA